MVTFPGETLNGLYQGRTGYTKFDKLILHVEQI